MKAVHLRRHLLPFSRFLLVGLTTAAIYFGVFALLHDIIRLNYGIAVSFGYASGVGFHFLANRSITFKASGADFPAQVIKYAVVATINYLMTLAIVAAVVELLGLSPYVGVIAALAITTGTGYVMFGLWVFRPGGTSRGAM